MAAAMWLVLRLAFFNADCRVFVYSWVLQSFGPSKIGRHASRPEFVNSAAAARVPEEKKNIVAAVQRRRARLAFFNAFNHVVFHFAFPTFTFSDLG